MTTIAYKDGVMACDSAWVANTDIVSYANKILLTARGGLLGCAGEADTRNVEKLFNYIKNPAQLPTRAVLDSLNSEGNCLFVSPSRRIWLIELCRPSAASSSAIWEVAGFDCFAIGSGEKYARAAMACGKTAVEAVEIATMFDVMSMPPFHTVSFDG